MYSSPCSSSLSLSPAQAQAAVKETKARFDKLKVDLTEKIGMVNASRCNLLSRSLPTYQKSMLAFSDSAASEFYRVLVDLRSHHHHQYKLHSDMEEIRDLESEEFTESSLLSPIEGGTSSSPLQSAHKEDDTLIDVSSPPGNTLAPEGEAGTKTQAGQTVGPIAKQEAALNDLPLIGVEADLRALQSELLQEFGSSDPPHTIPLGEAVRKEDKDEGVMSEPFRQANMDLNDLLGLGLGLEGEETNTADFGPLVSSEGSASEQKDGQAEVKSSDVLTDQWNNFSSFMTTTRTPTETSPPEWEKEFTAHPPPSTTTTESPNDDPFLELDPLAASKKQDNSSMNSNTASGTTVGAAGMGLSGLANDLFSLSLSTGSSSILPPLLPQSLIPPTQTTPVLPSSIPSLPPLSVLHPPFSSGLRQGVVGGAMQGKPHPVASSGGAAASKESEKKGTSWMNVFAHLDPLSNEKA